MTAIFKYFNLHLPLEKKKTKKKFSVVLLCVSKNLYITFSRVEFIIFMCRNLHCPFSLFLPLYIYDCTNFIQDVSNTTPSPTTSSPFLLIPFFMINNRQFVEFFVNTVRDHILNICKCHCKAFCDDRD